jgi:hypothetical protein
MFNLLTLPTLAVFRQHDFSIFRVMAASFERLTSKEWAACAAKHPPEDNGHIQTGLNKIKRRGVDDQLFTVLRFSGEVVGAYLLLHARGPLPPLAP